MNRNVVTLPQGWSLKAMPLTAIDMRDTDVRDERVTFYVQVYRDVDLARWCLGNFRKHWPVSRLLIISDGDDDPRWAELARDAAAEFHAGERLKLLQHGGAMLRRNLGLCLDGARTDYIVKFDTDTGFNRRLRWLPRIEGLFGTVQHNSYLTGVQGGFVGYSRCAAEAMHAGLNDPTLTDPHMTWGRDHVTVEHFDRHGLVCEDWVMGFVAQRLGLPCVEFPEVRCTWQEWVPNWDQRFAVTHPCKEMIL